MFTVSRVDNYNHGADLIAVRRGLLLKRMHKKIKEDSTLPVWRVFDDAAGSDSGDSDEIQQFSSFRTRLKRHRSKFIPPLPTDIDDVHIYGDWSKTWKGQQFLTHLDNHWDIAVFFYQEDVDGTSGVTLFIHRWNIPHRSTSLLSVRFSTCYVPRICHTTSVLPHNT